TGTIRIRSTCQMRGCWPISKTESRTARGCSVSTPRNSSIEQPLIPARPPPMLLAAFQSSFLSRSCGPTHSRPPTAGADVENAHARISVDTYDREYDGRVDSIAAATGARYSLLPPE